MAEGERANQEIKFMKNSTLRSVTICLSLLFLFVAASFFYFVAERAISAVWQWYKFMGHGRGVITLSKSTGLMYVATVSFLMISSYYLHRFSVLWKVDAAIKLSRYAMIVYGLGLILYFLVSLSPLNQWRP